ncbi:NfeD family protein [Candidatus Dependentiae bacterium]|nr:NfeD family protein [Candidatus Dependentiae bacterium]
MPPLWIIWSILGILFLVAEALTVGFFLGWFGIAAIITAVLSAVGVPFGFQVGIFIVLSVIGIMLSRKFAEKVTKEPPQKAAVDRLIGLKGIVTSTIDNAKGIGRITVDRDSWLADSSEDIIIEKDEYVKILAVSGTHLIVEPYKD